MTVPTNTYQTYQDVTGSKTNLREDLVETIYNVDPFKTPLFNMAKKGEATNTYHEWEVDVLAAQNKNNAAVEGDNPTNIAVAPSGRMGNYTQISTKTIQISGSTQAARQPGRANTMGYQLAKKSKELKRDIEGILTNNAASAVGNATTARISAGMPAWLTANTVFQTGGTPSGANPTGTITVGSETFGNGTTTRTYNSVKADLTEAMVKQVLVDVYDNSGESPEYALVSPKNKQVISTFTGPGTRFIEVEDAVLLTKVDVYQSDFGEVKIIPDIFLATTGDCYFVNPNYLKVSYYRPFQTIPLAKTGDSDQKMLLVEYALEMSNEHAHGGIFDTNG